MLDPTVIVELTEDGTAETTDTGNQHDADRIAGRDVAVLTGSDIPPRFEGHDRLVAIDMSVCEALVPCQQVRSIIRFEDGPGQGASR